MGAIRSKTGEDNAVIKSPNGPRAMGKSCGCQSDEESRRDSFADWWVHVNQCQY